MKTLNRPILWEEKNLIEHLKKYENNRTIAQNDIIKEIKNELKRKECSCIGKENIWNKKCPSCGEEQLYSTEYSLQYAIAKNTMCYKCSSKKRGNNHHTTENYVGKRFNKIIILKQYVGNNNLTMADYICDCGKLKTSKLFYITCGRIGSCGCQRIESNQFTNSPWRKKPCGYSAFGQVYNGYKGNARHGNKEFLLSKDDALKLFKSNCFYCNNPPSIIRKHKKYNGEFVYNGIDRKDNNKGYIIDNCVSCCKFCNFTKGTTPFGDFIKWIRKANENTKNVEIT